MKQRSQQSIATYVEKYQKKCHECEIELHFSTVSENLIKEVRIFNDEIEIFIFLNGVFLLTSSGPNTSMSVNSRFIIGTRT